MSIVCPVCGGETTVIETRTNHEKTVIRRRRECLQCLSRFRTKETIDDNYKWNNYLSNHMGDTK